MISGQNKTQESYRVLKNEPIWNRYISKSKYRWKTIHISFESDLLKFFDSAPLFDVRCKSRPWHELTYHSQKRWCKEVRKILNSTISVMNQLRRVKGSMVRSPFMVRSPSFYDSCKNTFQKTWHQNPPSSWVISSGTKRFGAPALSKDKWKRKEEHFGPVSNNKQMFNKLFNSRLTR